MRAARRARRVALIALVGLTAAGIGSITYATGTLDRPEGDTVDARFELRGTHSVRDVVVVDIGKTTFLALDAQWPFPRAMHGKVVDRLRRAGAREIAYDIQFTEPSRLGERDDLALFDAAGRARNVVFATTEVLSNGHTRVLGGDANLAQVGSVAANSSLPTDAGGVIRRFPYEVEGLRTFAVAAAERSQGHRVSRAAFGAGGAWIDYAGPPGSVRTIPFYRVLEGRFDPSLVRGKVVVIGSSAPTLQDVHPTPTSGSELMSGPEIQANAIDTVRRGFPLRSAPLWLAFAAIVALAMGAALAGLLLRAAYTAGLAVAALALYLVGAQLAFDAGVVVPVIAPALSLVLSTVGMVAVSYSTERRERLRTRMLFSRFAPEQVVNELLDRSEGEARLGGVRQEATVMFCDLRGFTRFSETLPAERVIEVLNRYLTEMSEAILDHGGTLVSYMGDGIMAVFGSPIERPDHADAALAAAREMVQVRLPRFNATLRGGDDGMGFRMGIGVNSGPVMSGQVGSERRLEYAAIGDTTNVAARLEAMTKGTEHQVFLSHSTRALLTDANGLVEVGDREVTGRAAGITIWALADADGLRQAVESTAPASEATAPA